MKIEKQILADHQARVTVEFDQLVLDSYKRRAARKIAERGTIAGFRPGKAPYEVVLRNYGEPAISERAVDLMVDEEYPAILKDAGLSPAAAGILESVDSLEPPKLTFLIPLAPEVDLGNYHSVRLPYKWSRPSQKELDRALEDLRQMYATTETVEREVRQGDYVLLDITSDTQSLARTGYATFLRTDDRENEWPFKGFARELVGMKAGDSKTISHRFPKDLDDEALQNRTIELTAIVKTVRGVTLPDLDDEFAKTTGTAESLEALREVLKKDVEARSKAEYDDSYFVDLLEKIKTQAKLKYAPPTLEHEAQHVLEDFSRSLGQQGMDLPTYYKMRKTDAARFLEEEAKPAAKKRLERSLMLDEVVRREKLEIDNTALDQEFNTTVSDLSSRGLDFGRIRGGRQGQQRVAEALALESANRLLTRRALDVLKSIATGEYKPRQAAPSQPAAAGEQASQVVTEDLQAVPKPAAKA